MRLFCFLLLALPVFADSVVDGGVLLSQSGANHLAGWLGLGDQRFTNIFSMAGNTLNGATSFHTDVDGHGPTFILMQTNLGLVGGYNPVSWNAALGFYIENPTDAGRTAFLFNLGNPTLYRQRLGDFNGRYQTFNYPFYGPTFGGGHDLAITSQTLQSGYAQAFSYGGGVGSTNVFGISGLTSFTVARIEAFTIASAVPEPASAGLFGAALGGLALLLRIRQRRG